MLKYSFQYLARTPHCLSDYFASLGCEIKCQLPRGLQVEMKKHWHTYQYICETDKVVCLGWDAYPESRYCVDENYFYIFWIPKNVFQKDWRRSLKTVGEQLGYFVDERYNKIGQIDLFAAACT